MRTALIAIAALCACAAAQTPAIRTLRVPEEGLQPQAVVAADGSLHLIYYKGKPQAGDLYYVKRSPDTPDFSAPIRVNSQPGSAVAMGNDRGGHIALGKNNRPHIAWNGSSKAEPRGPKSPAFSADNPNNGLPMLFTRLSDKADAFEPQRNAMTSSFGLDGGGSIAADALGHIYIVFHADPAGATGKSETERRVFIARSDDEGATFAPERAISPPDLGACGCCGLKAFATPEGPVNILFRAAAGGVDRDMRLLRGGPDSTPFADTLIHPWRLNSCPMTTAAIVASGTSGPALAWETDGNVFLRLSGRQEPVSPPGAPGRRKYPSIAANTSGQILLAWTEGMSWSKPGTVHWQLFSPEGKPVEGAAGSAGPVPAWSLVAAIAEPDGSFDVLY